MRGNKNFKQIQITNAKELKSLPNRNKKSEPIKNFTKQ
jgi:hypothetical protein